MEAQADDLSISELLRQAILAYRFRTNLKLNALDLVKSGGSERTELRVSAHSPPSQISKMVLSTVYVGGPTRIGGRSTRTRRRSARWSSRCWACSQRGGRQSRTCSGRRGWAGRSGTRPCWAPPQVAGGGERAVRLGVGVIIGTQVGEISTLTRPGLTVIRRRGRRWWPLREPSGAPAARGPDGGEAEVGDGGALTVPDSAAPRLRLARWEGMPEEAAPAILAPLFRPTGLLCR